MRLIIDRAKWLRGEGSEASRLLRTSDGRMCCLGMLALECGLRRDDIAERTSPMSVESDKWPLWLKGRSGCSPDAFALMVDNDLILKTGEECDREVRIADIFAKNGVEVEFVGPEDA